MKTAAFLLFMAAAALAQQQRKQQEPPRTDRSALGKPRSEAVDVSLKSGTELIYDDNILDLNNRQLNREKNRPTTGPDVDRFKIDDPDDIVYSVWIEARVRGKLLGESTQASLKVQPYIYQTNSIANYAEYDLTVRRDIGRHEAGLEYQFDHDVYLRELEYTFRDSSNIDTTSWESARYNEHDLEPYYRHEINEWIAVRGSAGYRLKDYESPFNYRDIDGYFAAVGPIVKFGKGIQGFLRYEFSSMNAQASSEDPDTSHRQHEIEAGAEVELFKVLELSLRYRVGLREYTSHFSIDDSHLDREDLRTKIGFRAKWKVSSNWSIRFEYVFRRVNSDRPHDSDPTSSEPGDSTRNTVMIGATFVF
jgi:hypothetical protein